MKTCITLICSLLIISVSAQLPRLEVQANQFVNDKGETIILRGYNTSDPAKLNEQGHWNNSYFDEISKWGANVVRFPVHPPNWRKLGTKAYLNLLDEGIKMAAERNLYVIIDWHSIGNLLSDQFYKESYITSRSETLSFWKTIAKRYGNNPVVAFYELFNEPTTKGGELGSANWTDWKSFNEEVIQLIQSKGGKGISLVAGHNWAYDLSEAYENPIDLENVAYVSHPYPQKRPKPWEDQWTADWGKMKEKAPVILTEIGFAGEEEKGAHVPVISDESYGRSITEYCNDKEISYVVWVFDAEWAPGLFSNWNYEPTRHGVFFKQEMTQ